MDEWVHAARPHVGVGQQIKIGFEFWPWIPPLPIAIFKIMDKRIDAGAAHILVTL